MKNKNDNIKNYIILFLSLIIALLLLLFSLGKIKIEQKEEANFEDTDIVNDVATSSYNEPFIEIFQCDENSLDMDKVRKELEFYASNASYKLMNDIEVYYRGYCIYHIKYKLQSREFPDIIHSYICEVTLKENGNISLRSLK